MSIKLSNSPTGRVPQPTQPKNTGVTKLAHERLQFTVAQANRQHQNALRVDGATTHYWYRNLYAGYPCTCSMSTIQRAKQKELQVDTKGGFIDKRLQPESDNSFVLRDSHESVTLTPPQIQANSELARANSKPAWIETDESDVGVDDFDFDPQELASQVLGENDIYPSSTIVCGVCKGFNRVGALQLWQGKHVVLDLNPDYQTIATSGSIISDETKPYSASGAGYVEWTVTLPQYFVEIKRIVARNNTKHCTARLTFIRSAVETDLTTANIQLLQGSNMSGVKIRAYLPADETITHIEMTYQLADFPVIAVPIWSANTDMRYENPLIQQQFEMGADIPQVNREDYFWESKNSRLWKVISIDEEKRTSDGQSFGYLITARIVHPYESSYLLSMCSEPYNIHKFSGIDYKQGDLSPKQLDYEHFKTDSADED